MRVWKSKRVTLVALGLLVLFAGYMNWTYTGEVGDTMPTTAEVGENVTEENLGETALVNATADENDYFIKARMDREEGRSKSIETLNTLISNADTSEESKRNAEAEVSAIAKMSDKEIQVENLIRAKGYEDAVVYMSEDSVSVVVKSDALTPTDISVIQEVVTTETGAGADKIKIVEVN